MNINIQRQPNENEEQYLWRIGKLIDSGIISSWKAITPLINEQWRDDETTYRDESSYRKKYNVAKLFYNNVFCDDSSVFRTILSISDLHVPFQKPIETFSDYVGKVDILQLNGDIGDCQAISRFSKTYRVSPMEELIKTRQYIIELINYLNPKKVVINYGNHDLRFQNYFAKNLDTDLLELMPKTSLELIFVDGFTHYNKQQMTKVKYEPLKDVMTDCEIEYVDNWYCQIGKTIFCHPCAYSSAMMKTAENAMTYFRNESYDFTSLIMAHTHKVGEYHVGNTTLYEQGCCCDTSKMNYSDGKLYKSQKEGFIFISQDKNGNIISDKTKLVCLN